MSGQAGEMSGQAGEMSGQAGEMSGQAGEMSGQAGETPAHPDIPLAEGGTGAAAYADAVAVYLAFALDKISSNCNSLSTWDVTRDGMRTVFGRQAIPMVWDYAEVNPFSESTGNWMAMVEWIWKVLENAPVIERGRALQADAQNQTVSPDKVVSFDPPYYDNIGYADLSDFFYVWLRRSLRPIFPDLFSTLAVPKAEELIASPYRHSSKQEAETFFLEGMTKAMERLAEQVHPLFPATIYYAFKQAEREGTDGIASTGWETFIDAVIRAGFSINGTWPMRTERGARTIGIGHNALASSIVLVCRPRPKDAPTISRRDFLDALKQELPGALRLLQLGNIAPVDLAQAAIGPGMAVYTRYTRVLHTTGTPLSVREALVIINQTLDEVLAEQEGDFDSDTRWALAWFEQYGFDEGEYGVAETLSKAKNTSVSGMVTAGLLVSRAGKVRLLRPDELPDDWDPATDTRLTIWEIVHHLVRVLTQMGEMASAQLAARIGEKTDTARELAYRLFAASERKNRAAEALAYNSLVQSWPEIMRLAQNQRTANVQETMFKE
jgi:putative DNA methylase